MKISEITLKIIKHICIVAAACIAIAVLLSVIIKSFTLTVIILYSTGVLITSALNCFKIIMIERTARKTSTMDNPEFGKGYVFFQYILRYFLTAIVVVLVVLIMYLITGETPFLSLNKPRSTIYDPMIIGLIVGLFTMKIAVITAGRCLKDDWNK